MHYLIGIITAVMVLFPASDSGGKSLYQLWMESYEKYLYAQMAENFEREERERNAEICQNPAESEVSIEQTASEEVAVTNFAETIIDETSQQSSSAPIETRTEIIAVSEVETVVESSPPVYPLYAVNGAVLSEEIQLYLFQRLTEQNIAYFMPYAMMICYQESKLDIYAENPNGRDKGLLQYRVEYVPWMDWRNPYQQIEYFAAQMANRAAAGCTVSEMISRHNTSDYGLYNQSYVDAVMQWESTLVRIR